MDTRNWTCFKSYASIEISGTVNWSDAEWSLAVNHQQRVVSLSLSSRETQQRGGLEIQPIRFGQTERAAILFDTNTETASIAAIQDDGQVIAILLSMPQDFSALYGILSDYVRKGYIGKATQMQVKYNALVPPPPPPPNNGLVPSPPPPPNNALVSSPPPNNAPGPGGWA